MTNNFSDYTLHSIAAVKIMWERLRLKRCISIFYAYNWQNGSDLDLALRIYDAYSSDNDASQEKGNITHLLGSSLDTSGSQNSIFRNVQLMLTQADM